MVDGPTDPRGSTGTTDAGTPLEGIPADALVLVAGPPMTGKYRLMMELLSVHADQAIVVSTKEGASRVVEDLESVGAIDDDRIGVVDCVSRQRAIGDDRGTGRIRYAESPENLTRIGVKFTELYDSFADVDAPTGVGLHSLSQLLMHSDVETVYQFLQVFTGHVRNAGWFGVSVIDDAVVDDQEYGTLQHHFDGIVQTRENDAGHREFRVTEFASADAVWTTF